MSETEISPQGQKRKTSALAIASVLISSTLFVGCCCFILILRDKNFRSFEAYFFPFAFLGVYLLPASFILGILGVIKVKKSKGLMKGYILSILGVLMSVLSFHYAMRAIASVRPEARILHCEFNMQHISQAMQVYSDNYNNQYPIAAKWCDVLRECADVDEMLFVCHAAKEKEWRWRAHYAINPNVSPNSPPDTVLLFETSGGWNQCGGPELLSLTNHHRKGSNILFNDGHVEFVTPRRIHKLKWKAE